MRRKSRSCLAGPTAWRGGFAFWGVVWAKVVGCGYNTASAVAIHGVEGRGQLRCIHGVNVSALTMACQLTMSVADITWRLQLMASQQKSVAVAICQRCAPTTMALWLKGCGYIHGVQKMPVVAIHVLEDVC